MRPFIVITVILVGAITIAVLSPNNGVAMLGGLVWGVAVAVIEDKFFR